MERIHAGSSPLDVMFQLQITLNEALRPLMENDPGDGAAVVAQAALMTDEFAEACDVMHQMLHDAKRLGILKLVSV